MLHATMRIAASVILLLLSNHQIHASKTEDAEALASNLVQWVRNSGGFVSDKIAFRHINDDATSPRGVFAVQDIDENETLAIIPWDLIIKSPDRAAGKVDDRWSHDDCGVIQETLKTMTASEDDMTPYGKYLLSQPSNYTVGFWTESGQELFVKLTGGTLYIDNVLPPTDIDDQLIWEFQKACGGDVTDPIAVQAAMLVRARSDYEYMVTIYGEVMKFTFILLDNMTSQLILDPRSHTRHVQPRQWEVQYTTQIQSIHISFRRNGLRCNDYAKDQSRRRAL
jgi:hypothetical protein